MIKGWILPILQSSLIKCLLKVTQKWSQGSLCMDKGKWMLGGYWSPREGHPCPYSLRKEHLWWLKQQQLQWGHCEPGWESSSSELSINAWLRHFRSDSEHFLVLTNLNGPHWQKWPIAGPLQHGGNFIFSQGRHSHRFRVHILPCSFATALSSSYPILHLKITAKSRWLLQPIVPLLDRNSLWIFSPLLQVCFLETEELLPHAMKHKGELNFKEHYSALPFLC